MPTGSDLSTENAKQPFCVGEWRVDPSTGQISRGDQAVKLEPRVMDVLVFLARRAGEVVTREELEKTVWMGRVVSYDALTGTMQKLRKALEDDPRNPQIIETLSKRGYRLIAAISPDIGYAPRDATLREQESGSSTQRSATRTLVVAGFTILFVVGLTVLWPGSWFVSKDSGERAQAVNSIAVLPFTNLSGNPDRDYFADGITDDLITELAKDPALFVIARDSSSLYKGQLSDLREVAEKLHVRYVLSGSVRREKERLRLNASLRDTETGRQVWGEHYDGTLNDVFALQDKIVSQIVLALGSKIGTSGRALPTRQRAVTPEAYEFFLHGRNRFFQYANKSENQKARELYLKALELDPDFALAYAMLAWTYSFDAMNGWSENREHSLEKAMELAKKAIALDEALPVAYFVTGLTYREKGEYMKALVEAEKAIGFDSNYANAHVLLATLFYYAGRPQESLELLQKAMRLNPHHPFNYPFHLGQAYYILERYPEAIEAFKGGLRSNPNSERLHVWLAAAYAQSGRIDDANWEAEEVLVLNPEFSLKRISQAFPFKEPADREHFLEGLRKAGLSQ